MSDDKPTAVLVGYTIEGLPIVRIMPLSEAEIFVSIEKALAMAWSIAEADHKGAQYWAQQEEK